MNKKFDKKGNLVYFRDFMGGSHWQEYDKNNNLIHYKEYSGRTGFYENWYKYDENNREIYYKNSREREHWYMYNNYDKKIKITKQKFENIRIKEYNSRAKCSRFEIMDI